MLEKDVDDRLHFFQIMDSSSRYTLSDVSAQARCSLLLAFLALEIAMSSSSNCPRRTTRTKVIAPSVIGRVDFDILAVMYRRASASARRGPAIFMGKSIADFGAGLRQRSGSSRDTTETGRKSEEALDASGQSLKISCCRRASISLRYTALLFCLSAVCLCVDLQEAAWTLFCSLSIVKQ